MSSGLGAALQKSFAENNAIVIGQNESRMSSERLSSGSVISANVTGGTAGRTVALGNQSVSSGRMGFTYE